MLENLGNKVNNAAIEQLSLLLSTINPYTCVLCPNPSSLFRTFISWTQVFFLSKSQKHHTCTGFLNKLHKTEKSPILCCLTIPKTVLWCLNAFTTWLWIFCGISTYKHSLYDTRRSNKYDKYLKSNKPSVEM